MVQTAMSTSEEPELPPECEGGRWVWVPDGKSISTRDNLKRRAYMREFMRKRRAKMDPVDDLAVNR